MRRAVIVSATTIVMLLGTMAPASAVIHVTVPADECASSGNAVGNPTAEGVIAGLAGGGTVSLPLGGFKNAPTACPAP